MWGIDVVGCARLDVVGRMGARPVLVSPDDCDLELFEDCVDGGDGGFDVYCSEGSAFVEAECGADGLVDDPLKFFAVCFPVAPSFDAVIDHTKE